MAKREYSPGNGWAAHLPIIERCLEKYERLADAYRAQLVTFTEKADVLELELEEAERRENA